MPKIQLITLDLDNTLWDVDRIIIRAEQQMRDWLAAHAEAGYNTYLNADMDSLRAAVASEFADQRHDLSFMRLQVLTRVMLAAGYSAEQARAIAEQAFEVFFTGRNQVEFFPHALEMLAALAERYPVYALTNGNANINRTGLDTYLKGAFSSAEVGASKPHPAMFAAPLQLTGCQPHEAVHIGDHLHDDIQGANDAGMHSIWVNFDAQPRQPDEPEPDHTVTELRDVLEVIDQIDARH